MKSFPLFKACLLFSLLSILFISCQKEHSIEGGVDTGIAGGTAVYSLAGDDGNCAIADIKGIYVTGNSLESSNTITIAVNVTAEGTYAITTNVANGAQFSAAGNFTVTGLQNITLKGTGIPLSAGTFSYYPPVGQSCAFLITFF